VGIEQRGFASMDRDQQRESARKGGKAAHERGTAHEWTSEQARNAGRKGGLAGRRRAHEPSGEPTPSSEIQPMEHDNSTAERAHPLKGSR